MKKLRAFPVILLLAANTLPAQLVNDGAANTLANVTNSITGTLTVGTNGSFTLLVLSNNVFVTNTSRGIIGLNTSAKSNEVRVISSTARWQMGGVLSVGSNGPSSRLVISGGGQVADLGAIVGRRATASNCVAIITDSGSLWSHGDGLILGQSSGGNQLVVSNGAVVTAPFGYVGDSGSENKTVVTGTGSHWTNDTDFVVGFGGTGNQMIVENGGRMSDGTGTVGLSSSAANNEATIAGTGSIWTNRLDLIVGQDGSGNRLVVSNGASAVAKSNVVAGLSSGAVSNTIFLTGPGTSLQTGVVLNRLVIGSNGPFNRLVISNGATATAFFSEVGSSTTSGTNEAVVTGAGSVWRTTVDMAVGKNGSGNRLTISDGALVSSPGGYLGLSPSGSNNIAIVTGPGSMWSNRFQFHTGYQGPNCQMVISNGASVVSDTTSLGNDPTSRGNALLVTGAGSMLSNSTILYVGGFGAVNQLTASGGATVRNQSAVVGFRSVSSNNTVLVTGAGTFWTTVNDLVVGDFGAGNRLTISNGATVYAADGLIGRNSGIGSNSFTVTGSGSLLNCLDSLAVGLGANGSLLTVASNGTVQVGSFVNVGSNGSTNNLLIVDGGTLRVTNALGTGSLNIQNGPNIINAGLIDVDRLVMTNASGRFEFNGGTLQTGNTIVSNGLTFLVGTGLTSSTLHLKGGIHSFSPSLFAGSAATVTGNGTIIGTFILNGGGIFSPGAAIGKIILSNTPALSGTVFLEISKNGSVLTNDQVEVAALLNFFGGTITVTNIGPTALAAGDRFQLFNATGYSGSLGSVTLPPLPAPLNWTNKLLVDGSIEVIAIPQPKFTEVSVSGTNLILSGADGAPGQNYAVLTATNVTTFAADWESLVTNQFGAGGQFSFTNGINISEPERYFRLRSP